MIPGSGMEKKVQPLFLKRHLPMVRKRYINYYFRLNFAGFEKIIDALGGITVNSDYEFDSQNTKGYHFNKGENHLNGEQALVFTRERYASRRVTVREAVTRWQLSRV